MGISVRHRAQSRTFGKDSSVPSANSPTPRLSVWNWLLVIDHENYYMRVTFFESLNM